MNYEEYINNILTNRGRKIKEECYYETHHIVPKCLGGTNDKNNLIDLYPREHFEAHRLLALENPHNCKLIYAWWNMSQCPGFTKKRESVSAEEYEEARMAFIQSISGENNRFYGKHHSEETKQKISEAKRGHKDSLETRAKKSKARLGDKNPNYGVHKYGKESSRYGTHHTEEAKTKMSEIKQGGKNPGAKPVFCEGVYYDCIKSCAEFYNVNCGTMRNWLNGCKKLPLIWQERGLKYA